MRRRSSATDAGFAVLTRGRDKVVFVSVTSSRCDDVLRRGRLGRSFSSGPNLSPDASRGCLFSDDGPSTALTTS